MLRRLGAWALSAGLPALRVPDYERRKVRVGVVHLGVGAFHRAHQAVYTDDVLAADPSWGIAGVSLRAPGTRDALAPQDGLYTLIERGEGAPRYRIVGSVVHTLVAPEDPDAVIDLLAEPATRVVTLTITEKGYCRNPAGAGLDLSHPDIAADLAHPARPRSMPGLLVAALARRHARGLPPFAVLSCDNLPANGHVTGAVLLDYARAAMPGLVDWMTRDLATPCSMVDRIVPATTQADRDELAARFGYRDAWPVVAEPFSQWVIEDRFPLGRPAWERAGATLTTDVASFETMKLRLLNGSHSALAYVGLLLGCATVAEAMAAAPLRRFVDRLARDELLPTLALPPCQDADAYIGSLHRRFANPSMRHALLQIAADGSQKLPQRLLGAAAQRLADGAGADLIATVLAAWVACWRRAAAGSPGFTLADPLAEALLRAAAGPRPAAACLGLAGDTGEVLAALAQARLDRIEADGVAALLGQALA
jgi:fructuronate reductase